MSDRPHTESLEKVPAPEGGGPSDAACGAGKASLEQIRALRLDLNSGRDLEAKGFLPAIELLDSGLPRASDATDVEHPAGKPAWQAADDIDPAHGDPAQLDQLAKQLHETPQSLDELRKLINEDRREEPNLVDAKRMPRDQHGNVPIKSEDDTWRTHQDGKVIEENKGHGWKKTYNQDGSTDIEITKAFNDGTKSYMAGTQIHRERDGTTTTIYPNSDWDIEYPKDAQGYQKKSHYDHASGMIETDGPNSTKYEFTQDYYPYEQGMTEINYKEGDVARKLLDADGKPISWTDRNGQGHSGSPPDRKKGGH